MKIKLQNVLPAQIEARSFEMITEELGDKKLDPTNAPIIKRVIHTSADFDYNDNLVFSKNAVSKALDALKKAPVSSQIHRWQKPALIKKFLLHSEVKSIALCPMMM